MAREIELNIGADRLEGAWFGPEPQHAPTVVMLHEGLGSVSMWREFPERIAEATNAGVFAYSRAGHGRSSPGPSPRPVDASFREGLDVLPRVLDAIGFRRGILLGHSDGASIATIYAGGRQDHRVRGLVLIEPHFNVERKNLDSIRQLVDEFASSSDLRDRLARHHADVDAMFAGWKQMWLDPRFEAFDISAELAYIRVPILIVKSEDDPYSTMLQVEIAERECYCPVETVVIPGSGHSPHRTQPQATLEAVAAFVNHVLWTHGEASAGTGPLLTA